jgi:hypothetical protein
MRKQSGGAESPVPASSLSPQENLEMPLRHTTVPWILFIISVVLTPAARAGKEDPWVERSNANARVLLETLARFAPETAGQLGVDGLDDQITQIPQDIDEQTIRALEEAVVVLKDRLKGETNAAVHQDLEILIHAAERNIKGILLNAKYDLPYFDLPQSMFFGIRALLDDQVPEARRPAAVARLRRYAGLEKGYVPLTVQAEAYTRARFATPGLRGPFEDNLEQDLANSDRYVDGIGQLCAAYHLAGYEEPYAKLKKQLAEYRDFLRKEVMPRASKDFRQPEELYLFGLDAVGVDMPVDELVSRAKVAFLEIQNEMRALAPLVAKERGLTSTDYRDVIRDLKKDQLMGDAILPHYRARIKDLERLIREDDFVTLPDREMHIRLASEAESAAVPAPSMRPPRMIGNTGEVGEFLLPLRIPAADGTSEMQFDDFTFEAASWTLTAHEGRPGHELQFASMIEKGVSQARALFAFNSVNVEGWALYCEAEMKPLLPVDGQLIALQHRLLRAARAFLDPGLQMGTITREEAFRLLEEDVVVSHAMASQEVERYTFRAPGQATSYFCGYTRLMELRTDAERLLDGKFKQRDYHDFILSQGLLPPVLLRKAVMDEFVKPRLGGGKTGARG